MFPFVMREIIPLSGVDPKAARIDNRYRFTVVKHNVTLSRLWFMPATGWTLSPLQEPQDQ
jgi:hypothetical protein